MRLLLIGLIFSSSAFAACPDLSGKYANCRSTTGNMEAPPKIEVTQTIRNGITTYNLTTFESESEETNTDSYKADGKTYVQSTRDEDSGVTFTQATSASCVGDALNLNVKITVEREVFATYRTVITKSNGVLIQTTTGTSMEQPIDDVVICE